MNKFFINHLFDIFTVGQKRNVDVGVACDMFRVDVSNGTPRNCGDALPGFDFAVAKVEWDKLDAAAQMEAVNDYNTFIHDHYQEACVAFAEGREAVDALVREVTA
jgi:hypothetical protein